MASRHGIAVTEVVFRRSGRNACLSGDLMRTVQTMEKERQALVITGVSKQKRKLVPCLIDGLFLWCYLSGITVWLVSAFQIKASLALCLLFEAGIAAAAMLVRLEKKRAGLLAAGIWYLVLVLLCCDIPKLFCKRDPCVLQPGGGSCGNSFSLSASGLVGNGEGEHGTGGSYRGDDLVRRSACHSGILLYKKRKQTAFRDPACRASDRSDGDRGSRRDWRQTAMLWLHCWLSGSAQGKRRSLSRSRSDGAPFWKQCLRRQSWSGFWRRQDCWRSAIRPLNGNGAVACFRKVEPFCRTMEKLRYDGAGKPHTPR